ncbi:helix-turn-helix domain-containing protein [Limibacter armeniacum]|uniref:helix-turn-helix domain-containing protein n=1 Tax=Limibacter armeniacum TaxID=466084 RepID=UPI002FE53E92
MTHLTYIQRQQIAQALSAGHSLTEIGEQIGVHRSSVSREVERNSIYGKYCPEQAHRLAQQRRSEASCHDGTIGNSIVRFRRFLSQKNGRSRKRRGWRRQKDNRYRVRDFLADGRLDRQGKAIFAFPGRHYNIQYRFCFTRQSAFCRLPRSRSLIKRWYRIHQSYWQRHSYVSVKVTSLLSRQVTLPIKGQKMHNSLKPPVSELRSEQKVYIVIIYLKVMVQLLNSYTIDNLISAVSCPSKCVA